MLEFMICLVFILSGYIYMRKCILVKIKTKLLICQAASKNSFSVKVCAEQHVAQSGQFTKDR